VVYLDKAAKTETKGLNEEFGFHINRPFYFVSELPFNRVLEMTGGNQVSKLKRWRNNARNQQFYFDEVTKTIRNNYWKSYCIEIDGSGNGRYLRNRAINSRWWQLFRYEGGYVTNIKNGKVFAVDGGLDNENRNLIAENKNNKVH
jgi:hypothetical protein